MVQAAPAPAPLHAGWLASADQLWHQGQRSAAVQACRAALDTSRPAPPVPRLKQLAYYLYLMDDFKAAAAVMQQVVERQPDSVEALSNLAVCLQRTGQHEQVLRLSEQALALSPDDVLCLDLRAKSLQRVGREADAREAGTRSLTVKDANCPPAPAGWALPPGTPQDFVAAPHKRPVIAFSLWGANPRYLRGALRNALLMPDLYPGWVMRLYADETVPEAFLSALSKLMVDVRLMPPGQRMRERLCWRFLVANDPTVGRFLVRDCDSVFSLREVLAVQAWCASPQWFHVLRDWWTHTDLMLAGLWGGVAGVLPALPPLLASYQPQHAETPNVDQWFLRDRVWPLVRQSCLVHDRFFRMAGSQALPAPEPVGNLHIGQDEAAAHPQRQALLLHGWIQQLSCLQAPLPGRQRQLQIQVPPRKPPAGAP